MLYSETIADCSEIHTKYKNKLRGQNVQLLNVKPGCTYNNQWALLVFMLHAVYLRLSYNCSDDFSEQH
jgi:hypothetical protein